MRAEVLTMLNFIEVSKLYREKKKKNILAVKKEK